MKLRLSYSLLSQWARGEVDQAIQTYFHMKSTPNKYMIDGRRLHEEIQKPIEEKGQFPDWFFDIKNFEGSFKHPENEKVVVASYNDIFDVKCIIDTYDSGVGFEYKTGVSNSLEWSRKAQIPFYFLVCELAELPIEKMYLMRWNQYLKEKDYIIYWNSKLARDYARDYIDSYGYEIYEFFKKEGLI